MVMVYAYVAHTHNPCWIRKGIYGSPHKASLSFRQAKDLRSIRPVVRLLLVPYYCMCLLRRLLKEKR